MNQPNRQSQTLPIASRNTLARGMAYRLIVALQIFREKIVCEGFRLPTEHDAQRAVSPAFLLSRSAQNREARVALSQAIKYALKIVNAQIDTVTTKSTFAAPSPPPRRCLSVGEIVQSGPQPIRCFAYTSTFSSRTRSRIRVGPGKTKSNIAGVAKNHLPTKKSRTIKKKRPLG